MTRRIFAKLLILALLALPVFAALADGSKDVAEAATAEALSATSVKCIWLVVQAKVDNTNNVFLGASTIADGRGIEMEPGETFSFPMIRDRNWYDLSLVYVDVTTNGEGVTFFYITRD